MEFLTQFRKNGYFTAELYHLLAKKKLGDPNEAITPSDYEKEMKMTTHERLQMLKNIEVDNLIPTGNKTNKAVLSFTPSILVFQNYKPNEKVVAKFTVKNISESTTHISCQYKESSYFSVKSVGANLLSRLAPGIGMNYVVTFSPTQHEDYVHKITFNTETDQYVLAFIAMGPRPLFSFPDEIIFPKTPLKVETSQLITVNNSGTMPAGFTLHTKCPFSVYPKTAYLEPTEKIVLQVVYKTMLLGDSFGAIKVIFETGEILQILLKGSTHLVSVELEKETVRFKDTFNTMARQLTFKITNKSDHLLTFMCMKNSCVYNDFEEKVKLAQLFYRLKDTESAKINKLVQYDVLSSGEHERIYTRIFYDEIHSLVADETLQFQNMNFSITPILGKLWPNKVNEITISFHPKELGDLSTIAYLDIDGVYERVPIKLVGVSLPPAIHLNLETLDMDRIYLGKVYNYEIVAMNKGHINGVIEYKDVPALFGSKIKCTPEIHCLRPGDKDMFVISFCNPNQGPFFEEVNFIIRHTNVVLKLYLKGEVVYPSLMFSLPCLDFGMVSLGLPNTQELEVINESEVDVIALVKISSDGPEVSSIELNDYAVSGTPKPQIPQWPREFCIKPSKVAIYPESRIALKVTLTANLIRANQTSLEIEIENSDSPPIVLPITYNAMAPVVQPAPPIKLKMCFIDYPYNCEICINCADFWGYFTLEEPQEESTFEVNFGIKEGMIKPNTSVIIPLSVKTNSLGEFEFNVRMLLFGQSQPIDVCQISGCGVRPIVTSYPQVLHWGQVKLLTKAQKTLSLQNDSPVVVNYKAGLLNKDGRWHIDPAEGHLEPESETDLVLSLYLVDAASYSNKAVIQLEKVKDIFVPLSATGVGTSIVVGDLRDRIDLGRNFTKIPLNHKVTVENFGTRLHALEWSEHYKAPKNKPLTEPFFNLEPRALKIAAGEKVELTVTGISHRVATVKETWFLIGSVEGINKKELLMECEVMGEFVDPKIEVSSTIIDLQYDYGPYSEYYKLTDIISIKNVSRLPLDIDLIVRPPFAIIHKSNSYKVTSEENKMCCCISYNEADLNLHKIVSEMGPQSRMFIDCLTLKPVEPVRRGPQNFFQDINKIKMCFNLTHSIEQRLEDQEVMKIQILLDTTKHLSLKSRVYGDVLKIKMRGHKNKDAMKLIGKINFPNILVLSPRVDFHCVFNGSRPSKTIKIQNITPLLACYRFRWKKCVITSNVPLALKNKEESVKTNTPATPTLKSEPCSKSPETKFWKTKSEVETSVFQEDTESNVDEVLIGASSLGKNYDEYADTPIDIIKPPTGINSSCFDEEFDKEYMKRRILRKIIPMMDPLCESEFTWIRKFPKAPKYYQTNLNELFQIVPHRGLLKPSEIQYIQVIFQPKTDISVKAILECEVLGGPAETIMVAGQSSNLMYTLNTQKLNFKIRSFHESASEQLIMSNITQLPFEYKTYLNEPKFDNDLEGTILDVRPPEKILEPEELAKIQIVVRPGVVGYFHREFLLEIGYLPHIPIKAYGWGVIPQIYLTLPRPDIAKLPPQTGYKAIPALTLEYLEAVDEIFCKSDSDHCNTPRTENFLNDPDFQSGWHICTSWDGYPSTMDIDLAIERMLVTEYIKFKPEVLAPYFSGIKVGPIPGFHTTPYVIDFGVVITGSTVQYTGDVINYGPIVMKLHFSKGTKLPLWLSVKLCGKLNPGETGKLDVSFSPTAVDFQELEQTMETSFNLEVPYGIAIPIKIKALCAVPYLASSISSIDFGTVRCGDKIVCSVPLKNVGKPTCIWYATLRLKVPGPNPMVILDSSGKYEPGEGGWLSVAFKPTMEMLYEGVLIFRFYMNPIKLTIPVRGKGVIPHVHIIGPNVTFPPTLPWSDTTDIFFGLTNPCPFPIELIIAHSDTKWKLDEEYFQLLYKYYNKPDEMLVPAIKPGAGLPAEVVSFCERFKETVRKNVESETIAASKAQTAMAKTQTSAATKKTKSPKNAPKTPAASKEQSPRKFKTESEIIADEIKRLKENNKDPLKESTSVFDDTGTFGERNLKRGLVIFFHGTPCNEMESQELAYSVGKKLHLPTVNIDLSIVEALCRCTCTARYTLVHAINDSYEQTRRFGTFDDVDEIHEGVSSENDDDFQTIWNKIQYLGVVRNMNTPRSKGVDKKKKRSPNSSIVSHTALAAMGSTTMFQMDLVQDLLLEYFSLRKFQRGFVVDSLNSVMIKNPPLALMTVLKCKHSIQNIHLVLCHTDFASWAHQYEETQREIEMVEENIAKVYDEYEIQQIIKKIDDMAEEEYAKASFELKNIYITYGLEDRRKRHWLKQESKLKKEGTRSDGKSIKDCSKSLITVHISESKKKLKKDDTKSKPTAEFMLMNARYNDYVKNTFEGLINTANNWLVEECDIGTPLISLTGQIVGAALKKGKKKSEMQLQPQMSEVSFQGRGFPLTIITFAKAETKRSLTNVIAEMPSIKEALRKEEPYDILKSTIRKVEYTVMMPKVFPTINHVEPLSWGYLDEPPIKKCECNQLTDLHLLDDSTQDNVLNILSKWHCTCGKKVASSGTSTTDLPCPPAHIEGIEEHEEEVFYPTPEVLRKVRTTPTSTGRIVLEPGDLVRCKFSFSPQREGHFSVKRFVEVSGWPDSRLDINVYGICDLPRLDSRPKKMFENFIRRTVEDNVYKITYLDDQKLFEFGPIFIGPRRVYEEEYVIDLKNCSLIAADVTIEFLEDTSVFQIDKTNIILEPGCRGNLTISAAPTETGVHKSVLLFCIKDNPEIVSVSIGCSGVVPMVEILPFSKSIEYGKLLLYRREDDRFIIKNDSILPIMWTIPNASEFIEDFIIAQTSGIVSRHDNQVIPVTYIACNVGVISNKVMIIHIFDEQGRGDPLIISNLFLSAECYDVMVECAFENTAETFLNYGNVRVNSPVFREMYLMNRGKYNIYFKLKKVKDFPEPSLLKSFEVTPETGIVPATLKLVTIEFDCKPTTSVNIVNTPAYICTLLDGSKNQVAVAKFPVCVSIASFYNTFTLFPLGELNFHIIAVGSGVTREVILNNTSKCPFTYEIVLPPEYRTDPVSSPPAKPGKERLKNPPLKCGNFLIMNDVNLVTPGTSRTIQIQFMATGPRKFEETIHFIISDTCPAEANGVPLKLVGTGAMPSLDFWNLETTFREHLIVKNLADYKVQSSSAHCIFEENSATLHFLGINVNTTFAAAIDLYNNGLVPCALTMKLHYQFNSNPDIFSLDKYETHVEPLMHKNIRIIFSPKSLTEYRAVLEIKLKLLYNQEESFKICLIGEGVIPRIKLISPQMRELSIAHLNFPVTCLGSISTRLIRFKNISRVMSYVKLKVVQKKDDRPIFCLNAKDDCVHMLKGESNDIDKTFLKVSLKPNEIASIVVHYNPIRKGKNKCEVKIKILENPYEGYTVFCESESFMADVILVGLEMMPLDGDVDSMKMANQATTSSVSSDKKSRSAPVEKKKSKALDTKKSKRISLGSASSSLETSLLKYVLDFGGCELGSVKKKSAIMVSNSDKVYKFAWEDLGAMNVLVKPSEGYISPGEEKDFEFSFFAGVPVSIQKELFSCYLTAITNESLTVDLKGGSWDNRQIITLFDHNQNVSMNERCEVAIDKRALIPSESEDLGSITMLIIYTAMTSYTKYICSLKEKTILKDTFIYQTRSFSFYVENIGVVPMKVAWSFQIDEGYPARTDKHKSEKQKTIVESPVSPNSPAKDEGDHTMDAMGELPPSAESEDIIVHERDSSKITLFSNDEERNSIDTWFEKDLPFKIEPAKECLNPGEKKTFKVTFSPLEAFKFKVGLKGSIDNLDPFDQNIFCVIIAKSLVPYVHLDIEENDYLTSGRRKETGIALPPQITVLEFNVLGWGCYKKSFNVINPTEEAYEFIFEMQVAEDQPELIPMHCNTLKGFVEGGTSTEVTFTFSPTAPGVYESQWKFIIPIYNLVMNLLVVGVVREPDVVFMPTILLIRNTLVGFTSVNNISLKNNENEALTFEIKGNSLCNESGKTPIVVEPPKGVLKPLSLTPLKVLYTPIQDGPLSFKLYCNIKFKLSDLTLCVDALSHCIKSTVTYLLMGNEHVLNSEFDTHIHLDQTASTYERTVEFTIKNDGSATFFYNWMYNISSVRKYLQVDVVPQSGHVSPGRTEKCILHFKLKQVPVLEFPVTLSITDGPEYSLFLHAEIEKPLYHFSCKSFDFDKCFIYAPDDTYKKNIAFVNDDKEPLILDLNFQNVPELFVDYRKTQYIMPGQRFKLSIYFRPKTVREYEFTLQFWVNSLCEEIVTIKGEGIRLLFDLYEGCQKSFDLGPVRVGENIVRTIEVMNQSKIAIDASFIFRNMYPLVEDTAESQATSVCLSPSVVQVSSKDVEPSRVQKLQTYKNDKVRDQIAMDIKNALSSLKVVPNRSIIKPYNKVKLKIQFKPVGMISYLDIQLNMKVLCFERPLVKLNGSATGMHLCFSQNSLQFGRVRKRGCKNMKVMLMNKGDFGARFWWQPLISDEFSISPLMGHIAPHTNVTFTLTFRPKNHNPFIKVWASCNIENYTSLTLAMYATCVDVGTVQQQTVHLECPVREIATEYISITNPAIVYKDPSCPSLTKVAWKTSLRPPFILPLLSEETWLVLSECTEGPFETLREFNVEPNTQFDIPLFFKPKAIGKFEAQVLFSPLGEAALFLTLVGSAGHPNPNGNIEITVPAKETHVQELPVYHITVEPETYMVVSECMSVYPDKFNGFYSINHPEVVKTWGEAAATCRWEFSCYEVCEMQIKVVFINQQTREYQYYLIKVTVTPSKIVDTLVFKARARETVQKELVIKNPLGVEAVFNISCDKLTCPEAVTIGRLTETVITMGYSPLVIGESECFLEVTNNLVGTYIYKVILRCLPAKQKDIDIGTPIGNLMPLRLRVQNRTDTKTVFSTTVSHASIQAEREYTLGPDERGKFIVWFEPIDVGTQKCKISFESPTAGAFVFNIKGKGLEPKPQGPYKIVAGGYASIQFKNIFDDIRTFKISVDKEEFFYVKTLYEQIKSKRDIRVMVYLIENPSVAPSQLTGRLTIETFDPPTPRVQWTYFLQGT